VAQQVSEGVAQKVQVAGLFVLTLLFVLAVGLGVAHRNLFRKHIQQPLETIRQRLLRFQGGDYCSPLPLNREDEWGQIEEVFNNMLADRLKSWSALQESERRYRNIFENAGEGIFQSSLQGRLLNINPAMANILGYDSADEALVAYTDLSTQLYVQPGFREQLVDRLRVKGSVRSVEVRMRRRNGEIFWASLNGHLIKDEQGNERLIEGTLEDISTRRAAEESLRQLQRHLQNIIDSMPSILIGIDVNCQVTLWNKQAEQLCKIPAFEAKGRPLQQVFSLLAADSYLPQVMETLRNREPQRLEKLISVAQGRQRYLNLLIYPLATTEASGAVIHIDEVTEQVKMDEMIVQSEKMLSVGGLAAGMAHEINNPLAVILQNAQVLGQRLSPALDKNRRTAEALGFGIEQLDEYVGQRGIKQMLQSVTESGQRAAKIVENMLSFSRKSSSRLIPQSLADLVEQALVLAASDYDLKHKFDFRNISIVRDFAPVPAVPCEASQIQQVILNLLKNAAYALGLKAADPQIVLRIFQQEQMVCLQVEDNGPGIDVETRKRIFEPFYTTKEVGSGTGLGLSVAYFIITENHRGRLTAASDDGQGSCFTLELPLPSKRS
jgi:PAS domain S-box-containing protein